MVTLDLNYRITSFNPGAEQIVGFRADEVIGKHLKDVFTEASVTNMFPENPEASDLNREVTIQTKSGMDIFIGFTVVPRKDKHGHVVGSIITFRDITDFKHMEAQVIRMDRVASLGVLASGIAHEIRNPLSSIKGFATYFSRQYENEPEDVEIAKIMVQEVERMDRSITQLLEFAKPMAVQIKQTRIEPLIQHSLKLVSHDLRKKKIRVQTDIRTGNQIIHTDPERISQVLLNLYMNALNAMDTNGLLEVGVTDVNNDIEIRVADNGCGIPAKDFEKIFDPYFTTRPKGTGLGLSIVHRIVENLKGEIRVESQLSKGTVFYITLPDDETIEKM